MHWSIQYFDQRNTESVLRPVLIHYMSIFSILQAKSGRSIKHKTNSLIENFKKIIKALKEWKLGCQVSTGESAEHKPSPFHYSGSVGYHYDNNPIPSHCFGTTWFITSIVLYYKAAISKKKLNLLNKPRIYVYYNSNIIMCLFTISCYLIIRPRKLQCASSSN